MGEGRILENFTIDQLAGSTALILGAFGGLLTIIWKSRCLCRFRVGLSDKCYIFDCSREPPPPEQPVDEEGEEEEESVLPRTESQKSIGEILREDEKLKEKLTKQATEPLPEPEPST